MLGDEWMSRWVSSKLTRTKDCLALTLIFWAPSLSRVAAWGNPVSLLLISSTRNHKINTSTLHYKVSKVMVNKAINTWLNSCSQTSLPGLIRHRPPPSVLRSLVFSNPLGAAQPFFHPSCLSKTLLLEISCPSTGFRLEHSARMRSCSQILGIRTEALTHHSTFSRKVEALRSHGTAASSSTDDR